MNIKRTSMPFHSRSSKLVGQLFSAFCSSARENFATVFGSHSLSEAMLFLSLELLWLICSYHDS